jgi:surface-anchored protein
MNPKRQWRDCSRLLSLLVATLLVTITFLHVAPPIAAQSSAVFEGPHADRGLDDNGDGYYDILEVEVFINVSTSGLFYISSVLLDQAGSISIDVNSTSVTLADGLNSVNITFKGVTIYNAAIDGPYNVSLVLLDELSTEIDTDTHITGAYNYTDFRPAIIFTPPHEDWAMDTDGNGLYDVLQVNASVNTTLPGFYMIFGILTNSSGVAFDWKMRLVNLTAGDHVIQLNFSGIGVFLASQTDSFLVFLFAPNYESFGMHTTSVYSSTEFESGVPATLSGSVKDEATSKPLESQVWLVNKTHKWLMMATTDNITGDFTIEAFQGDFLLLVSADGYQDEAVPISISGSTTFDFALGAEPLTDFDNVAELSDWEYLELSTTAVMPRDNQTLRFMADQLIGNGDLVVDDREADLLLEFILQGSVKPTNTTKDMFEVDGTPYDLVEGSWAFSFNVTGPLNSTEPIRMAQNGTYRSASAILPAPVHQLRVNITYDDNENDFSNTLILPSQWVLLNSSAPAGIQVEGLNNNTVYADPGLRPSGEPPWAILYLNATTDSTPPQVTDAWASPDPQEVFGNVTIAANITENSRIVGVTVNITDPAGTTIGNFTMDALDEDTYAYTATFDTLGVFNFTVWAEDDSGFVGSLTANFTIHDTTSPVLGTPTAAPETQEVGEAIQFSVQVSDNYQMGQVSISIVDPDGSLVGNFTMTLSGGQYTYTSSFSELGTFTYTIWASDTSGNYASVSGEFTVEDTTPPTADAGEPMTVMVGDEFTLDGTGSTDNHRIVEYTWTFQVAGETVTLSGAIVNYTFTEPGTYTITLTVKDEAGNIDTATVTITVEAGILTTSNLIIIFGAIAAVILALGVGYYMLRRRGRGPEKPEPPPPNF